MRTHMDSVASAEALHAFTCLHRAGLNAVDNFTFPIALKACAALKALKQGQQIHSLVLLLGVQWNVYIGNALISMYCSCGNTQVAARVFDHMPQRNTVTWNSIMTGCIHNGLAHESFSYFRRMIMEKSLLSSSLEQWPDSVTMCTILNAHARLGPDALRSGRAVHGYITRQGHRIVTKPETTRPFVKNALIHMYIESLRCLTYAEKVFQGMAAEERDVVTWTTMISGYLHCKLENKALETFQSMLWEYHENASLDAVTLAAVIPALRSLWQGKEIHCFAIKNGHDRRNMFVISSLLNMYAEYGAIGYATKIFQRVEERNVVVWTAMIMGYAKHGLSEGCLRLFDEMRLQAGVTPNELTFMGVFTACSHAGLVEKAQECFKVMTQEYGLMPDLHHYAAMVDVLGRAGRLREARNFIEAMPMKPSTPIWGSLLAYCGLHQDMELAEEVAKIVLDLEPDNPGNFVHLSNMLAQEQRWDDASMVRETMKCLGLKKVPGCSFVHAHQQNY
ncbi:pentatricopeptide repeat-containing protein At4g38010-like [Macadamia integrifolia]|uniref:pentatricopeptide repeat-containing protein At4g38010-like n=1 Tax=Macadamia integrifolia TaxID=60698 RepID=UPI001C4F655F|nr:pentatricopeptide repeat-containing protein At4g38010-like [Macadamia integrifolia]XP_042507207.1 pentatricopeptide repeat-containing protein At4g38010-like [Macadamia integrifolia]XP_042507208.1 pentatricopeptide repeat-containing protein At4g38010-like [Macadamia integrifolia]XP_042507209.1 pentatricopeptide repeat-containing protein At4g38010-like [Macadamia integrifolia]XP_042507210.1 pentatricopeptide repeat-containing protein At4g38010-like [Macadamia integrifolia]